MGNNNVKSRSIERAIQNIEQDEGIGAKVRRSIGSNELCYFDPFLQLDDFTVTAPGGFPDQFKSGFIEVTYVLEGEMKHEHCYQTKEGPEFLKLGDIQWMKAGRGILQCQVPDGNTEARGLHLLINMPSKIRDSTPSVILFKNKDKFIMDEKQVVSVRNMIEDKDKVTMKVLGTENVMFLDFKLQKKVELSHPIPSGWNVFIYIISGKATFGEGSAAKEHGAHYTLVLDQCGESIRVKNTGEELCHFVLIGGKPLSEQYAQYGSIVMKTPEGVQKTVSGFKRGGKSEKFGWESTFVKNYE